MKRCGECGREFSGEERFCPDHGVVLQGSDGPPRVLGSVVAGRYHAVGLIGRGDTAVVYRAHHLGLDRPVALKVLHPHVAEDQNALARFQREACAASRLSHPNIVEIYDIGYDPLHQICFVVMEHVHGHALSTELKRGPIAQDRVAHILAQVGAALADAHAEGVAHGDVRPGNIMLTQRGVDADFVKLIDFGLAREFAAPKATSGRMTGSPGYMAPELWRGAAASAQTDLYAVGCTAFQCLVGRLPFRSGQIMAQMNAHLDERPDAPSAVSSADPAFDGFVSVCLEKTTAHRFHNANAFLTALGHVWSVVTPKIRNTTYAMTAAAPPPPALDALSDPTMYQPQTFDPAVDAASLAQELLRLHALREARLVEVSSVLFKDQPPPPELRPLRDKVRAIEKEITTAAREITDVTAARATRENARRVREAKLREQMVGGGLRAAGQPDLEVALRAERATGEREDALSGRVLAEQLKRLRRCELALAPLYDQLSEIIFAAAGRRRDVRTALASFSMIDGALSTYHALFRVLGADAR